MPSTHEVGDHAVVTLPCEFPLITPLASAIVGQPVGISAVAEFMVRGGVINGIPIGGAPPPPACVDQVVPNMIGASVATARTQWAGAGFTGAFTPTTGSDAELVTGQTTTPPSSPNDCLVSTATVVVTHANPSPCTSPQIEVPSLVGMTVAAARSAWAADFSGAFTPTTGSDTNIVSAQTTVPVTVGGCAPASASVTVTHAAPPPPQCTMPQLLGLKANAGSSPFTTAGFTGPYTIQRPPNGNYDITTQSLVGGLKYVCTSGVTVAGN